MFRARSRSLHLHSHLWSTLHQVKVCGDVMMMMAHQKLVNVQDIVQSNQKFFAGEVKMVALLDAAKTLLSWK